jgi:hypothetical protein
LFTSFFIAESLLNVHEDVRAQTSSWIVVGWLPVLDEEKTTAYMSIQHITHILHIQHIKSYFTYQYDTLHWLQRDLKMDAKSTIGKLLIQGTDKGVPLRADRWYKADPHYAKIINNQRRFFWHSHQHLESHKDSTILNKQTGWWRNSQPWVPCV